MGKKLLKIIRPNIIAIVLLGITVILGFHLNSTLKAYADVIVTVTPDASGNIPGIGGQDVVWTPGVGWHYVPVDSTSTVPIQQPVPIVQDGTCKTNNLAGGCGGGLICCQNGTCAAPGSCADSTCPQGFSTLCNQCCATGTTCTAGVGGQYQCIDPTKCALGYNCFSSKGQSCVNNVCVTTCTIGTNCFAPASCVNNTCTFPSATPTNSPTPTKAPLTCDPVPDGVIDEKDKDLWIAEYTHSLNTTKSACLSPNHAVDILGFQVWKNIRLGFTQPF